jgi:hypothetical protein
MGLVLSDHVHAVAIDADVVFLDVHADVYYCLVGAGEVMALSSDGSLIMNDPRAADALIEAGLLTVGNPRRTLALPPRATRGLVSRGVGVTPARIARAWRANVRAAAAVDALSFAQLIDLVSQDAPSPNATTAEELGASALEREAARFARQAPWLPRDGVCLMRSLQQLFYLRAYGFRPTWVFGVRTWPFQAHCWLQAGPTVLDDSVEHVGAYAPILAI